MCFMYHPFRRNNTFRPPYGFPCPNFGQPIYHQHYGAEYHSYWHQSNPNFHMTNIPNNYHGYGFPPFGQQTPYPTPYPTGMGQIKPKAVGGILNQFKKKDGTYDVNKMMDTAGQMVGAVNQVNSIVKGLTKTFKV